MPGFTPGRRWQTAYSSFEKENFGNRALQVIEYAVKSPWFECRMCGESTLTRDWPDLPNGMSENIMERMEIVEKPGNAQEEGVQIALELISKIKRSIKQGIGGIHLMPVGWDEVVPCIITEAGLFPRDLVLHI